MLLISFDPVTPAIKGSYFAPKMIARQDVQFPALNSRYKKCAVLFRFLKNKKAS